MCLIRLFVYLPSALIRMLSTLRLSNMQTMVESPLPNAHVCLEHERHLKSCLWRLG